MIGDDFIIISSATDSKRQLGVRDQGELYFNGHSSRMRFSDFKNNFLAEANREGYAPVVQTDGANEVLAILVYLTVLISTFA